MRTRRARAGATSKAAQRSPTTLHHVSTLAPELGVHVGLSLAVVKLIYTHVIVPDNKSPVEKQYLQKNSIYRKTVFAEKQYLPKNCIYRKTVFAEKTVFTEK